MKELKELLKAMAAEIKKNRLDIADTMRKHEPAYKLQWERPKLKSKFRHHHIAYCLLRGRTYEQIENFTHDKPDFNWIEEIKEKYDVEAISPSA